MFNSLFALALAATAIATPMRGGFATETTPPLDQVYIKKYTYRGSGCQEQEGPKVGASLSPDRSVLTIMFHELSASIGPSVHLIENRRSCQVNIELQYPRGWQYSILRTTQRGSLNLDGGINATARVEYYYSDQKEQLVWESKFAGPSISSYTTQHEMPIRTAVWSPCGATNAMNVKYEVQVRPITPSARRSASGVITGDSLDTSLNHVAGLQWQACGPNAAARPAAMFVPMRNAAANPGANANQNAAANPGANPNQNAAANPGWRFANANQNAAANPGANANQNAAANPGANANQNAAANPGWRFANTNQNAAANPGWRFANANQNAAAAFQNAAAAFANAAANPGANAANANRNAAANLFFPNRNAAAIPGANANQNAAAIPGASANQNAAAILGANANQNAAANPGANANQNAAANPGWRFANTNQNAAANPGANPNQNAAANPGWRFANANQNAAANLEETDDERTDTDED